MNVTRGPAAAVFEPGTGSRARLSLPSLPIITAAAVSAAVAATAAVPPCRRRVHNAAVLAGGVARPGQNTWRNTRASHWSGRWDFPPIGTPHRTQPAHRLEEVNWTIVLLELSIFLFCFLVVFIFSLSFACRLDCFNFSTR